MPKLPRTWHRNSGNVLLQRDGNINLYANLDPGQTLERVHLTFRAMGNIPTGQEPIDQFDAFYFGVYVLPNSDSPVTSAAWSQRNTLPWMWWEGQHFGTVLYSPFTSTQDLFLYPFHDNVRDIRAKRLNSGVFPSSVWFAFARSGGVALDDQRVNACASILVLG